MCAVCPKYCAMETSENALGRAKKRSTSPTLVVCRHHVVATLIEVAARLCLVARFADVDRVHAGAPRRDVGFQDARERFRGGGDLARLVHLHDVLLVRLSAFSTSAPGFFGACAADCEPGVALALAHVPARGEWLQALVAVTIE